MARVAGNADRVHKKGSKKKRVTWKKGHSSDSNPSKKQHRLLAKQQLVASLAPKLFLTSQLNELDINDDENVSVTSGRTALSAFTNCTNATFERIYHDGKFGSPQLQKDCVVILAAVADVLKTSGGSESEVEYFAALLSHMDSVLDDPNMLAANVFLLSMVLPKLPRGVLRLKAGTVLQKLFSILRGEDQTDMTFVLQRGLISCLGSTLAAIKPSDWAHSYNRTIFTHLLHSAKSERPRVRKAAKKAVAKVVFEFVGEDPEKNIPGKLTVDFAVQELRKSGSSGPMADVGIHVLNLLAPFFHVLPGSGLKSLLEQVLNLLADCSSLVALVALQTLRTFLANRPSSANFSQEICAQFLRALYDFKPAPKDTQKTSLWISALFQAHLCLMDRDAKLCMEALPFFLETLLKLILTSHKEVQTVCIREVINTVKSCFPVLLQPESLPVAPETYSILDKCLAALLPCLSTDYIDTWPHIWAIFGTAFETLGPACVRMPSFEEILRKLCEYREGKLGYDIFIEGLLGLAMKHVGVEPVLHIVPLELKVDDPHFSPDIPRAWLLPVIRANLGADVTLEFFRANFLPATVKLYQRYKNMEAGTNEAKLLQMLEFQIWDLFPAFCKTATDVEETYPKMAQSLGAVLLERPDIRDPILRAIRCLVQRELKGQEEVTGKVEPELGGVMSRYAKNYLPILFSIYTGNTDSETKPGSNENQGLKMAALETVKLYVKIAPENLFDQYLKFSTTQITGEGVTVEKQCLLLTIIEQMIPRLTSAQLGRVFTMVKSLLEASTHSRLLKRVYRMLLGVAQTEGPFLIEKMQEFSELVLYAPVSSRLSPSARGARFRCLQALFGRMQKDQLQTCFFAALEDIAVGFCGDSIPERSGAARAFVAACSALSETGSEEEGGVCSNEELQRVFMALKPESWSAPVSGDLELKRITGSIICTRLMVFEYKNHLEPAFVGIIIGNLCPLLASSERRIVQSSLECLITIVRSFGDVTIGQYLDMIVPAIWTQTADCQHHFRFLSRKLLIKLTKRFSAEFLAKWVPEEHQKQLNHVRKMVGRWARKDAARGEKTPEAELEDDIGSLISRLTGLSAVSSKPESIAKLLDESDDSDSDAEEGEPGRAGKSGGGAKSVRSSKAPIWLEEPQDGEALDLLNFKDMATRLHSSDPRNRKGQLGAKVKSGEKAADKNLGFKTNKEGKLVIVDSSDEEESRPKASSSRKRVRVESAGSDANEGSEVAGKKAKKPGNQGHDSGDSDFDEISTTLGYKPGGKGIHRDLKKAVRKQPGSEFRAKKARGDVKRKTDKYEPYAYMSLSHEALNKRKRAAFKGAFKSIVSGGQKGGKRGKKKPKRLT